MKGEVVGLLEFYPVLITALTPFRQVLLGDPSAREIFGKDGLDFGHRVEPWEKFVTGDTVIDATLNKSGSFRYRATKVSADTALAQIVRLVQQA